MNRKLTAKEKVFLLELRELMMEHNVLLCSENDSVRIDIEDLGDDDLEPVMLPQALIAYYDLDDFIKQNS